MTSIEWVKGADGMQGRTLNPVTGCAKISPGCGLPRPGSDDAETGRQGGCYAMAMAARLKAMGQPKYQRDGEAPLSGLGFGVSLHPEVLNEPLRRRTPTTYFVCSMSDLFNDEVPDEFIAQVFAMMAACPQHTFQILSKRAKRMASLLSDPAFQEQALDWGRAIIRAKDPTPRLVEQGWPLPGVWCGVSIESDPYVWRANHLRNTPAAVRFLSLEPLLGPLTSLDLTGIDWVIVGAESGRGARPMDLDWVRPIRDECVARSIPFFLKQTASVGGHKISLPELDGRQWTEMP